MSKNRKTLIILDSNAIIHRSFHALPDFRTAKGELVNAVYGFTSILLKVLREFEPDYVAAAFDVAGPTFREEEYEEYKAKRPKAPDELYAQIPRVKEVLGAFNIAIYEKMGFEADDIIGTIARLAPKRQAHPPVETVVVSGDLDTLQLVDEHTKVYTMRKGLQDTVLYDEAAVRERFGGLGPEQMVDYKGLRGDPSDNIPGITGIGEKTAIQLLSNFTNMEKMYSALEKNSKKFDKYSERIKGLLRDYKNQAFFSRELAEIRRDVPIEFNIKDLIWRDYNKAKVEELFEKLEFRTFLGRLPQALINADNERINADTPAAGTSASIPEGEQAPHGAGSPNQRESAAEDDSAYQRIESLYKDGVLSKDVYEFEKKLVPIIRGMERAGIKIDRKHFAKLAEKIIENLSVSVKTIYKIAGKTFNVNSPRQLSEVLFAPPPEGLSLPAKGLKKTPGGAVSTAAPELEKLLGKHPIIKELLHHRELQKLNSTYITPLPKLADNRDRIHTQFDQLGTATGRLSSSRPNLQNIPARGAWGEKIRKGFIAEKGSRLVSFDYSQMELRLAAHIAGDKKMKQYFKGGEDIHAMTAAEVFGLASDKITKDMRFRAKALNFGVLYGMGASGFAKSANISRDEAQDFIDNYFLKFPAIRKYIDNTIEFAHKNGYVETLLGRKRYFPEATSSHPGLRAQAERMAINHPIQGTAADIIKMAMVKISGQLTANSEQQSAVSCKLILQIHDELLFEIVDGKIEEMYPEIKNIMENICSLSVPLEVDVLFGRSWGELKQLTANSR